MEISKKIVSYWRKSLADELALSPNVDSKNSVFIDHKEMTNLGHGIVPQEYVDDLFTKFKKQLKSRTNKKNNQLVSDSEIEPNSIPVTIAPFYLSASAEHQEKKSGKYSGLPSKICPLWIPAVLLKSGKLEVSDEIEVPWISRDYLGPVSKYSLTLGDVDVIDVFFNSNPISKETIQNSEDSWKSFYEYARELYSQTIQTNVKKLTDSKDISVNKITIVNIRKSEGASKKLIEAYDQYLSMNALPERLKKLANLKSSEVKTNLKYEDIFDVSAKHLGHMNPDFGLTESQRECISYKLQLEHEDFFVIIGPPGTGKTTIIQSLVGNDFVKSALSGDDFPKVTVISSANNQAIENVLDSMLSIGNSNPFNQRWIDGLDSYGLILPGSARKTSLAKSKYEWIYRGKEGSFVDKFLEIINKNDLKSSYIKKANEEFNVEFASVIEVKKHISEQLETIYSDIKLLFPTLKSLQRLSYKIEIEFSNLPALKDAIHKDEELLCVHQDSMALIQELHQKWLEYVDVNLSSLLFWKSLPVIGKLSFISDKIGRKCLIFANSNNLQDIELNSISKIDNYISSHRSKLDEDIKAVEQSLSYKRGLFKEFVQNKKNLIDLFEKYDIKISLDKKIDDKFLSDFYNNIDITLRTRLFYLAVHYWEAKWLETSCSIDNYTGNKTEKKKFWSYVSMLTPCIVSTLYSGPTNFQYKHQGTYIFGKDIIDVLLIDEAGQASAAISAPLIANAKKVILVGDSKQIEPVAPIIEKIDQGNLRRLGLLNEQSYDELRKSGVLHSTSYGKTNGNLIRLGQSKTSALLEFNGSVYKERGTFLREHWRCHDEIISFCNDLCYDGHLVPMVGNREGLFRPWNYAHIRGEMVLENGSRSNPIEAEVIIDWIKRNEQRILEYYNSGKKDDEVLELDDLIGIVTPFSAQRKILKDCINQKDLNIKKVGTVHSLQGAEKPIVIFSPVYSYDPSNTNYFFDRGPNMLNVAASRAKDSFIVMGDMEIFDSNGNKPSSLMLSYLEKDALNEIKDIKQLKPRRYKNNIVKHIKSLDDHRKELKDCIVNSRYRTIVVSPWVSKNAVKLDDIIKLISSKSKEVEIIIYVDLNKVKNTSSEQVVRDLKNAGAIIKAAKNIHSKILMVDQEYLVEGSFNWLSAMRKPPDLSRGQVDFRDYETSIAYSGSKVSKMIDENIMALDLRVKKEFSF